tara:strand:+ start:31 stop:678 length:648 start_codon:yes stop_codon:yes gene_type:complete
MSNNEVVIIDYGVGNIFSVRQGLEEAGASPIVTSDIKLIQSAKKVVLPGVGAFKNAMNALNALKMKDLLINIANEGVPFLGICLGMQLLFDESDEFGLSKGLGLIPGRVETYPLSIDKNQPIKIPQINWHELIPSEAQIDWKNTLLDNQESNDSVYFVHSFVANPVHENHKLADYISGGNRISAMVVKENIIGCQFHPEKSGRAGISILKNFMKL